MEICELDKVGMLYDKLKEKKRYGDNFITDIECVVINDINKEVNFVRAILKLFLFKIIQ